MKINCAIDGMFVVLSYRKFSALGSIGRLDKSLKEIDIKNRYNGSNIVVSPIISGPAQVQAAFNINPFIYSRIAQLPDGKTPIIAYGDNRKRLKSFIEELQSKLEIVLDKPSDSFIRGSHEIFDKAVRSYEWCMHLQRTSLNKLSLRKVVGAYYYKEFLEKYCGFSKDESYKRADKIFRQGFGYGASKS